MSETWPSFLAAFAVVGVGLVGMWVLDSLIGRLKRCRHHERPPHPGRRRG